MLTLYFGQLGHLQVDLKQKIYKILGKSIASLNFIGTNEILFYT